MTYNTTAIQKKKRIHTVQFTFISFYFHILCSMRKKMCVRKRKKLLLLVHVCSYTFTCFFFCWCYYYYFFTKKTHMSLKGHQPHEKEMRGKLPLRICKRACNIKDALYACTREDEKRMKQKLMHFRFLMSAGRCIIHDDET